MWIHKKSDADEIYPRTRFYTPQKPTSYSTPPSSCISQKKRHCYSPTNSDKFQTTHKVPPGDSPYVKAKHVQIVEKDPGKAVSLFWNAINSGDRVDSALKDMAAVMKQLNRPDEAIEAIKSFRHLCPPDSQESVDNILVELYKKSGRLEEEIEVLHLKLKRLEEVHCFGGKILRVGRSHGKRIPVLPQQEYTRLLGNLAWAYLQLNDYKTAEEYYRKALSVEPDRNKQCNLAICLMCMNKITEAKFLLHSLQLTAVEGKIEESYAKSYERASELLTEIESQSPFQVNKENYSPNRTDVFAFTPYKFPTQSSLRSPLTQPRRNLQTPPPQAKKLLDSPFTQPIIDSRPSNTDNWRKETRRNNLSTHLPRRLQFENLGQSDFQPPTALQRRSDTDNWRKGYPRSNLMTHVPYTQYFDNPGESIFQPPTDHLKRHINLPVSHDSGTQTYGKKSWADLVEEEEEEQQKRGDSVVDQIFYRMKRND